MRTSRRRLVIVLNASMKSVFFNKFILLPATPPLLLLLTPSSPSLLLLLTPSSPPSPSFLLLHIFFSALNVIFVSEDDSVGKLVQIFVLSGQDHAQHFLQCSRKHVVTFSQAGELGVIKPSVDTGGVFRKFAFLFYKSTVGVQALALELV